ncbi:MAG: hypothetical protein QNI87_07360 [Erythrobacter sp.]|uniref:hypothetical protein n=1 Tax=Erythrobacter sp. TaxID=1042 RepID=UPI00261FB2AC|nr:hypothetical protein [Erythrobacter sp.]MDJ0978338.1 hypothetical protein [Erythrobacter sp.]
MRVVAQSLTWACVILFVALVLHTNGVSASASTGVVFGLVGAAWGTLQSEKPCPAGCLM